MCHFSKCCLVEHTRGGIETRPLYTWRNPPQVCKRKGVGRGVLKTRPWDLVLKRIFPNVKDPRGKFALNYEGPFIAKHDFSGGATILTKMDGGELSQLINADALRRFYT
ncbi:hypothetical protein MLD38_037792 [Melastoma candidum]|uniref:Uncharacterized protein n=1 Tax=Melastoma candidum TaxID=119954 RepID=A0ACB9LPF2_9MYRT|nr:hypothetical protein MLD38_037792 [Melastoma candidum]